MKPNFLYSLNKKSDQGPATPVPTAQNVSIGVLEAQGKGIGMGEFYEEIAFISPLQAEQVGQAVPDTIKLLFAISNAIHLGLAANEEPTLCKR